MKVLITGADGFIGKNLRLHLSERKEITLVCFTREHDPSLLYDAVAGADIIFHLAGVNRSPVVQDFCSVNYDFTVDLCKAVIASKKKIPVVYTSSIQATQDNPYGTSKRAAELAIFELGKKYGSPVHVFRLPNVFGKWCKPHYNSVVATFCHQVARDLPLQIHDADAPLQLVYVDDVVQRFMECLDFSATQPVADEFQTVAPQYTTTVGQLAEHINAFKQSRDTLSTERVGTGFLRALYSTYVSYLPADCFSYPVVQHRDPRGVFVEMLKTPDCGQFSFFTAHPGVTRGGHYHHTKTEKFLVIKGHARFQFRHMLSGEMVSLVTTDNEPRVVETIPGWTHDITNIGESELLVMLWANEVFDRSKPDTFSCPL